MNEILEEILFEHDAIYNSDCPAKGDNIKKLNNILFKAYGVVLTNPDMVNKQIVNTFARLFDRDVPSSFYSNPQDSASLTSEQLLHEQLLSYYSIDVLKGTYDRIALYPIISNYLKENKMTLRVFKVVNKKEARKILSDYSSDLEAYETPFSPMELDRFKALYKEGYHSCKDIACKDNIISMLDVDERLARYLDEKDIVKYSMKLFGYINTYNPPSLENRLKLARILEYEGKSGPLTRKQAKYYNKCMKLAFGKYGKFTNEDSPYKIANDLRRAGKPKQAFRSLGTLSPRCYKDYVSKYPQHLRYFTSLLGNKKIILNLLSNIDDDNEGQPRSFYIAKDNVIKIHEETNEEVKKRKSFLSPELKAKVIKALDKRLNYLYDQEDKPTYYIAENFEKVAIPFNTSYNGTGLGVLPTGSRIKIDSDYVRIFAYWHNHFDIDMSVTAFSEDFEDEVSFYYGSFHSLKKKFGKDLLSSGDCRARNGAEYIDVRLDNIYKKKYRYLTVALNSFGENSLDVGEVFTGIQYKDDLNTVAWQPNNIRMRMQVKGKRSGYLSFVIDVKTKEIIIINQAVSSECDTIHDEMCNSIKRYISDNYLHYASMAYVLRKRAIISDDITKADVVFDDNYTSDTQTVIRSYDIEKLKDLIQ